MDVSIIIVNWNTRDLLRNCLRSIRESAGPLRVQVIVVDNNSADGSREMVTSEFPEMMLINSGANLGFARANNIGIKHAVAPLILYLNPDTEIRGDALVRMVAFMRENSAYGGLGCRIRNLDGTVQPLGLQWFPNPLTELFSFFFVSDRTLKTLAGILPTHDAHESGDIKKLFGACLLVRKDAIDKLGAFDDLYFMYCEDVDLCYKLTRAGWKLRYMADVEILHLGGAASASAPSLFSVLMMCESFSKFMRKHHGAIGSGAYRAVTFVGALARLAALSLIGLMRRIVSVGRQGTSVGPFRKYQAILKWSLGMARATVKQ